MTFKVYSGPMEIVSGVKIAPKSEFEDCRGQICVWMSDRYCFDHCMALVVEHDSKMKERLNDSTREN